MFRDFKERGPRLEASHITQPETASRLMLAVCLAYAWLLNAGIRVGKHSFRTTVDRRARRQRRRFQRGWRFLRQRQTLGQPVRCSLAASG